MRKQLPTLILRIIIIMFSVAGLLLCIFLLPSFGTFLIKFHPAHAFWRFPVLIGLYAAAACYFFAVFQFWLFLNGVDRDGTLQVKNLKAIRISSITFSVLYFLFAMPMIFLAADLDDAPGMIPVGALIDMIPIGAAALAAILERNAIINKRL